jgi:uncharacterized protein YecE (DUF72 family)
MHPVPTSSITSAEPERLHQPSPAILIGCAGWSLNAGVMQHFPAEGTHLERYARVLPGVEINSSFYRPHKPDTYARWRDSVPDGFRFAVKVPKAMTHEARLRDVDALLARFAGEVTQLQEKLGCLLVQLAPSLRFEADAVDAFFARLRETIPADVACEPRHPTWFTDEAMALLASHRVSYVDADPPATGQRLPADNGALDYIRLHGTPVMYYSNYSPEFLEQVARRIEGARAQGRRVWCIFDNTAEGHAQANALWLQHRLREPAPPR